MFCFLFHTPICGDTSIYDYCTEDEVHHLILRKISDEGLGRSLGKPKTTFVSTSTMVNNKHPLLHKGR
jgi:hypothetical protein